MKFTDLRPGDMYFSLDYKGKINQAHFAIGVSDNELTLNVYDEKMRFWCVMEHLRVTPIEMMTPEYVVFRARRR